MPSSTVLPQLAANTTTAIPTGVEIIGVEIGIVFLPPP